MNAKGVMGIVLLLVAGLVACGDSTNGETSNSNDSCEPRTECEQDECGSVDDGCDGTLDCGECPCVDGQPQYQVCGDCDLGVLECGDDETGHGVCDEPQIPGWYGSCDNLVFVSQEQGSAQGTGTVDDPIDTLEDGLSTANSSDATAIVVGGSANYQGPLLIDGRRSIVGGFSDQFQRDSDEQPTIESGDSTEGLDDGDVVGMSVQGVEHAMVLKHLNVTTEDVEAAGKNNYGLHVHQSPGLHVEHVDVSAGRGGDGVDGQPGEDGEPGQDGGDAYWESGSAGDLGWLLYAAGVGGENDDCPDAAGGEGGDGGSDDDNEAPTTGEDAMDALGGAPGHVSDILSDRGGEDGQDGPAADGDSDGDAGVSMGEVVDGRWVVGGDGHDGMQGPPGSGGGGGGGGGHNENWSDDAPNIGSYGGGGGAGGCGGYGGEGGGGGGGSFGLFVVDSPIDVADSEFVADVGGDGGSGGAGGRGGDGGEGGEPLDERCSTNFCEDFDEQELAGFGGDGAEGATGGHGGGGAGGVSYGAHCTGSAIETDGDVQFSSGGASLGGSSMGENGESGVHFDEHQCL